MADLASSLQDIQVQRGAGSAFYGPAAIGGSINLVTDRFHPEPRVTITTGYGSYDTRKIGITLKAHEEAQSKMTRRDFWLNYIWGKFLALPALAVFIWQGWWAGLAVYAIIVVIVIAFLARRDRETGDEDSGGA